MSKIEFRAKPGTEIGTNIGGKSVVFKFDEDGRFETDDIAVIDLLLQIGVEKAPAPRKSAKESKE